VDRAVVDHRAASLVKRAPSLDRLQRREEFGIQGVLPALGQGPVLDCIVQLALNLHGSPSASGDMLPPAMHAGTVCGHQPSQVANLQVLDRKQAVCALWRSQVECTWPPPPAFVSKRQHMNTYLHVLVYDHVFELHVLMHVSCWGPSKGPRVAVQPGLPRNSATCATHPRRTSAPSYASAAPASAR